MKKPMNLVAIAVAVCFIGGAPVEAFGEAPRPLTCQKGSMRYPVLHGVFSVRIDGTGLRLLSVAQPFVGASGEAVNTNYDKLHVSPDGRKIVFLQCVEDRSKAEEPGGDCLCDKREYQAKQVVIADLDGGNPLVVGTPAPGRMNEYPNWSPDGTEVVFVQSASSNPLDTDLFTYDLATAELKNLTNSPCRENSTEFCMETDHFWNKDGTVTVVKNHLDWVTDETGRPRPSFAEPNNLFQFDVRNPAAVTQLTHYSSSFGQHCCVADPKRHPASSALTYAAFEGVVGEQRVWNVMVGETTETAVALTESRFENLYPLWSSDGGKLAWTSWDENGKRLMKVVKDVGRGEPAQEIVLIGPGSEGLTIFGEKVYFTSVGWQDWLHPANDTLVFPGSFVATPELLDAITSHFGLRN